jgi:hypothetical protein
VEEHQEWVQVGLARYILVRNVPERSNILLFRNVLKRLRNDFEMTHVSKHLCNCANVGFAVLQICVPRVQGAWVLDGFWMAC